MLREDVQGCSLNMKQVVMSMMSRVLADCETGLAKGMCGESEVAKGIFLFNIKYRYCDTGKEMKPWQ